MKVKPQPLGSQVQDLFTSAMSENHQGETVWVCVANYLYKTQDQTITGTLTVTLEHILTKV